MISLLLACAGPGPDTIGGDSARDSDTDTADTDTDTDTVDTDTTVYAEGLTLTVHPDVSTVLVATWTQLATGNTALSWELDGDLYTSPVRTREPGVATEFVFGLPETTSVTVTLDAGATSLTALASTGALPGELVRPTMSFWDPGDADPAPWLLTSVSTGEYDFFGPFYVVIVDRLGRIVWYRLVSDRRLTWFPRVSYSGTHLIWEASTYYVADTLSPTITRATLSLSQEVETELDGLGFTFDELPDGSLIFDHFESGYAYHLERLWPDGTRTRIWSCAPWMESWRDGYWDCAPNTVRWDPLTNVVTWSMFQTSTIVGIDLDTGHLAWELGEYPGGYTFDPADVRIELPHYPHFTPAGTLLLTAHVPDEPGVQRIRELSLDHDAGVATQIWTYASPGYYGTYAGEATRLDNGNTLVNFGTDGVLQEVTPGQEVAWELDWDGHLVGHLTPIADLYTLDAGW